MECDFEAVAVAATELPGGGAAGRKGYSLLVYEVESREEMMTITLPHGLSAALEQGSLLVLNTQAAELLREGWLFLWGTER